MTRKSKPEHLGLGDPLERGKRIVYDEPIFYGAEDGEDSDEQPERDGLLIVGDSYSNPIERLFSAHYKTVYAYDARNNDVTIQEYLSEHPDIEDVVFLMHSGNFVTETSVGALQLSE